MWTAPALLAFAYLIVLLADFQPVITSITMHGDVAIAPVLGKLAGQAPPGSLVLLGHHPWYEEFLYLRATSGLPFYRQLWEVSPALWTLAGFALLAWAAWRALGGFAALLTTSALVCLGDLGRFIFFAMDWHGLTVAHTIVICAALVWLAPRAAEIGWVAVCALAVALGLIDALPVASDALFPFWALIPMCVAAVAMAHRNVGRARWTPLAFALLTLLVSLAAGRVVAHVVSDSGVATIPFPFTLVGSIKWGFTNFEQLLVGWMKLGGGGFPGLPLGARGLANLASGLLILAALVLGLMEVLGLATTAARRAAAQRAAASSDVAGSAAVQRSPGAPAALAYVTFWTSSLLVQAAVFVATSVPKVTPASIRYALAGYVAIMALMPLLVRRGPVWRGAAAAGVCVFALSAIFQLAGRPYHPYGAFPGPSQAQRVLRFARAQHVTYGYANYWVAPDLTWLTRFKVQVYPVITQRGCGPTGVCPYGTFGRINSWYRLRPGTRSLLIADRNLKGLKHIPPPFGRPLAIRQMGSLTLAVYGYDIASRL